MSQPSFAPAATAARSNSLALPLLIVCVVAVAEAVGLIALTVTLAHRRPEPAAAASLPQPPAGSPAATGAAAKATTAHAQAVPNAAGAGTPAATPAQQIDARGFSLGKKGQRVESAGFAVTVDQIRHEPGYKDLANFGDDSRYLALLILVENNTGGNAQLFTAMFRLQDDQGFSYEQLGVKLTEPKLEFTVMGNREKVRGYLDFVIPKTAKGLKLIYSGLPTGNSQPIHIDLAE